MKKRLTIQTNFIRSISIISSSINSCFTQRVLANPPRLFYGAPFPLTQVRGQRLRLIIIKISSTFGLQSRAFFSTNSQPGSSSAAAASAPGTPIKVYENADTQKQELLKESEGKTCVYMWTNLLNGKRYVGSAMDLRRRLLVYYSVKYLMSDPTMNIYKALLKYGYSSFSLTILEICKKEDVIQREQHYIDTLCPEYNICKTAGSTLGKTHTAETKEKIGVTKSGTGEGVANSMFGKIHTEEALARKKMAEAKLGKTHTEETKAKLRAAAKGRKFTEEHIKNLSASQPNSKKLSVLDLQTGIETTYGSINEAARCLSITENSIRANMKSMSQKPYKGIYVFKTLDSWDK